jgi:uncharacterized protein YoxC
VQTLAPVQPVTDTLQSVSDPVQTLAPVQPVTDTLETVSDPVQTITDPVQLVRGTLQSVTDPVQTVNDTLQTVTDPVQTVTDPVQTVADTVQPVQTVADTVQPVADTVQPVADTVQPVADATTGAVGTATQAAASITDASSVGATVEKTAGETNAVLSGAGESLHDAVGQVTYQYAGLSDKLATMTGIEDTGSVAGIPGHFAEHITPSGTGIADVGGPISGNGGAFDVIPFEGPGLFAGAEEALIVSAGLVTLAGLALAVRPSAVMSAQFYLANVRQIAACGGVRELVNGHVSAAVAGTARLGVASGGAVKGSAGAVKGVAEDIANDIRDGFLRGVSGSEDDGASDTRLLMQIGMLLGSAYIAFPTVWFWATRLRWNPRT